MTFKIKIKVFPKKRSSFRNKRVVRLCQEEKRPGKRPIESRTFVSRRKKTWKKADRALVVDTVINVQPPGLTS